MRQLTCRGASRLLAAAVLVPATLGSAAVPAAVAGVPQPDCNTIWQRSSSGFYEDNKPYLDTRTDTGVWQTATPASQNMNGALLAGGITRLAQNPKVRSVLVARRGRLIFERYVNGGAATESNNIHSASKSILQALLGIAVQRGFISSLDARASSYLPAAYFLGEPAWKSDITIRGLISMRSQLSWVEDVTENSVDGTANWVDAIIGQPGRYVPPASDPTNIFNYSTGNTHVVSNVIQQATGMSTCAFAGRYLFSDLGIALEHWGRDPQAVYSGGYNVYMTARELATFAELYRRGGVWNGVQLVPSTTVTQARTPLSHDSVDPQFQYSQGWWIRTISGHEMFFQWGYGGQFGYVIPDLDLVVVVTQNTQGGDREIDSGAFLRDVVFPAVTGP